MALGPKNRKSTPILKNQKRAGGPAIESSIGGRRARLRVAEGRALFVGFVRRSGSRWNGSAEILRAYSTAKGQNDELCSPGIARVGVGELIEQIGEVQALAVQSARQAKSSNHRFMFSN